MTLTTAKWTLEEYHRLAEAGILDDRRVELLKENLVEMALEGEPHADSSDEAGKYLTGLFAAIRTRLSIASSLLLNIKERARLRCHARSKFAFSLQCCHWANRDKLNSISGLRNCNDSEFARGSATAGCPI